MDSRLRGNDELKGRKAVFQQTSRQLRWSSFGARERGGRVIKHFHLMALLLLTCCKPNMHLEAPACPIDRVIYAQEDSSSVTAGFGHQHVISNYASDLVFYVKKNSKSYWFGFSMPNGYGGPYIYRQIDPKLVKTAPEGETPDDRPKGDGSNNDGTSNGQINFDAFDAKHVNLDRVPQSGDAAPAFLFSAELGPHFHYGANGGDYSGDPPVEITRQLWHVKACDDVAH
jgi:hypothetical protein